MEIVHNSALLVRTRNPDKITEVITKSQLLNAANDDGVSEVLVHWDLQNAHLLKNLGFKKPLSPILGHYNWPGIFKPFAHQKDTAAFLTLNRRCFCLSAMGSGKTSAAVWAADYLLEQQAISRVLIICPLSIMDCAWRKDLFNTAMHRHVEIAHGAREQRLKVIQNPSNEFVIINYDGVESVLRELQAEKFDLVICDESTAIKNPKTRRWKMVNALIKSNTWLWLLTGTPAAHSPMDAYGQIRLVNPGAVPSYIGAFKDKVMTQVSQFRWLPRPEAQDIVYSILQPAIRYTTEDCLDLPEQLYTTHDVGMTPQQTAYYKKLRKEMLIEAAGEEVTASNAAVKLGKLLQISSGGVYSDTGAVIEFDCSNKLNELLDVINQASHKVLVFCIFRHSIDRLTEFLGANDIINEAIHGGITAKKRTDIFNRFQTQPNPRVLLIQPQAAAHGVTLTAANVVVWFSPTTSTEIYLQANARVHRAGQTNPCLVVHLCSSPVEKELYHSLEHKTLAQASLLSMYKSFLGAKI